MFVIENRPDLRRAFYRLLAISPQDDALTEHDDEIQETVHFFLQHGLWNAQYWLLTNTPVKRWLRTFGPIKLSADLTDATVPFWSGGGQGERWELELPEDFIRLAGDDQDSALYRKNEAQRMWGQEISQREKNRQRGNWYYLENDRLYLAPEAQPPADLLFDYYYRHPILVEDDDEIEFPVEVRPLIVAEAAAMALAESWLPFEDAESEIRILRNLEYWRRVASSRGRQTRTRQKLRGRVNHYGTNWF